MPRTSPTSELNRLYKEMLTEYPDGISSTSTAKFDKIDAYLSKLLNIPIAEIYSVGAGTRPGNLEVRLTQGIQATKHTTLGIGFTIADKKKIDSVSDSCVVTIKKFIGRSKATYDAVAVVIAVDGELVVTRLVYSQNAKFAKAFLKYFPKAKPVTISAPLAPAKVAPGDGVNKIFFGSPGTSKSHYVDLITKESPSVRVTFHPEYTYADFIGSYKPVVGHDAAAKVSGHDGKEISKPVNYFSFVPGPFILAVRDALLAAKDNKQVFLIIEEINRGDCAAIFGDTFQLLDRAETGQSKYPISLRAEISAYFESVGLSAFSAGGKLLIPSNLSIFATMNTSDQSLYPMDSAFKRRWKWEYCSIANARDEFNKLHKSGVLLIDDHAAWQWLNLVNNVNSYIVKHDGREDKQVGPWFILPTRKGASHVIAPEDFRCKYLFYLWHDVFRESALSAESPFEIAEGNNPTFGDMLLKYDKDGAKGIFKKEILDGCQVGKAS